MLKILDLSIRFAEHLVVDQLNLSIAPGQFHVLVGESGSGKSMTGLAIGGLTPRTAEVHSEGIYLQDCELSSLDTKKLRRMRGDDFAYIFQEPMTSLNPVLRIRTQMTELIKAHRNWPKAQIEQRCLDALAQARIDDPQRIFHAYPHQLSGGLRQRVMIAMSILLEPRLLIADEPTTALDVTIQKQILVLLKELCSSHGMAVLFITHDLDVAEAFGDIISVMYAGQIVESGPVAQVLKQPAHPYTEGLLCSTPNRQISRDELCYIPGRVEKRSVQSKGCAFYARCPYRDSECVVPPRIEPGTPNQVRCIRPLTQLNPAIWKQAQ